MPRKLTVTVLKDEQPFLNGTFDVKDEDYPVIVNLLKEVEMTHGQAASMLSGYMHAGDVGQVTAEMGKLAMLAVVYMLEAGETEIEIPLETGTDTPNA
ncbi:hypothetical protein ACFO5Q_00580 [Kordiimonas lipolytica]|uniref:Phage tail assembly chaperone protein, E, or 41 or 14 n=1 Tax=Kordiimonas lipolytica TaxID=1662421 RepID=A0ABV8U562_9PROT|nr:hypothetical protein [Kordiimonas lipolytica]